MGCRFSGSGTPVGTHKAIRIKNEFGFVPWNCLHLFALKAASVGLVLTAGGQALAGNLALPYFLMIALFSFTIFGSVEAINDAAHILSVTDSVLDRLEELDRTDFIDRDGQEVKPERFDVEMDHIFFGYSGREVLHDISFAAPQGDYHGHCGALRLRKEYHLQSGGPVL